MKTIRFVAVALLLLGGSAAQAAKSVKVTMNTVTADGVGKSIGTITVKEGKDGVTIEPKLKGLTPGEHGFHLHEKPSCDPADKDGKKTAAQAPISTPTRRRRTRGRAAADTKAICPSWSSPTRARPRTRSRSKGSRWPTSRGSL